MAFNFPEALAAEAGNATPAPPAGPGPNNVAGFGRVDLARSLVPHLTTSRFEDAVGTGEMTRYALTGVPAGTPLKVTLVWTDNPAAAGIGSLGNRLDLTVRTPSGAILEGDVTPTGSATNNVQQVLIASPAAGDYQVRVSGDGVPRQDFAVVASGGASLARV